MRIVGPHINLFFKNLSFSVDCRNVVDSRVFYQEIFYYSGLKR